MEQIIEAIIESGTGSAPSFAPELPAFTTGADTYAVVEVFGHRSHIGRIREVTFLGRTLLEIVTPELQAEGERTEREDIQRDREYNYDTHRYDDFEQRGRWVREPAPAVASETFFYGGDAIFSIQPISQDEAYRRVRSQNRQRGETWVPDGPPTLVIKSIAASGESDSVSKDEDSEGLDLFGPTGGTGGVI